MVPALGGEAMKAPLAPVEGEGRVELGRSMAPTAIDDQHALWVRFAEGRHHLMQILTPLLSIKVRHDFVEDFGDAILDRANDAESHPAGDADPGTILHPRLVFAGLLAVDVALAQGAGGEAIALTFPSCIRL